MEGQGHAGVRVVWISVEASRKWELVWGTRSVSSPSDFPFRTAARSCTSQRRRLGGTTSLSPSSSATSVTPLLYCGGVYVLLYLKDPGFPLRDPKRFAEGLMERYIGGTMSGTDPVETSNALSAAGVELFRTHPLLRYARVPEVRAVHMYSITSVDQ